MKYIIHALLKGDIEKYQHGIVDQIAKKFGLKITKEENLDTHFTLKYWFETEDIEIIERICENFCRTHKRTRVRVGGFGNFTPNTIFINVTLSEEAKKTFFAFIKELRKIRWMPWDQYDGENLHFHSTIAEKCNNKFEKVWQFVQGKEKYFDCWFEEIAILKLVSGEQEFGKWEIHKTFLMTKEKKIEPEKGN